jgi:hypothetical protein
MVRVTFYSYPCITVSSETTGVPFRRLLRLAGITVEVFLPSSTRVCIIPKWSIPKLMQTTCKTQQGRGQPEVQWKCCKDPESITGTVLPDSLRFQAIGTIPRQYSTLPSDVTSTNDAPRCVREEQPHVVVLSCVLDDYAASVPFLEDGVIANNATARTYTTSKAPRLLEFSGAKRNWWRESDAIQRNGLVQPVSRRPTLTTMDGCCKQCLYNSEKLNVIHLRFSDFTPLP